MSPAFLACRTGTVFSRFSGEHEADVERWGRREKITPVHALLFFRAFTSLRKKPTFPDATTGFPAKGRLRNERRNSILMTQYKPDLGIASDWSCRGGNLLQPIRCTAQVWVVTRHQYGISALVSQTSFRGEKSGDVAKCRLSCQATTSPIERVSRSTSASCSPEKREKNAPVLQAK